MEMERQQHSRTPQTNDPKRDRNSGQRSMGHIEANSRAEGQEDSRRRTISFSSEEPYRRWFGMEILDHAENAPDLSRLNDVGVLLFNHDTDKVVGTVIRAWVENHRGVSRDPGQRDPQEHCPDVPGDPHHVPAVDHQGQRERL